MFAKLIDTLRTRGKLIVRRYKTRGVHSAWICLKAQLINVVVYLKNRFSSAKHVACPCCGWQGNDFRSLDCESFVVLHVMCPHCGAHERQRIMHVFLSEPKLKFMKEGGTVLHFAPDRQVHNFLMQQPKIKEINVDLDLYIYNVLPGCSADLMHLPFPDNAVDGLFCQHVLEHVPNDVTALSELYRVLKPGGEAVIMVPVMDGQLETEEYGKPDPDLFDHMRGYSILDFPQKLAAFELTTYAPKDLLNADKLRRYKIPDNQVIYVCVKK